MSTLDFENFDDEPDDEQGKEDRSEEELKKLRDMLKDDSSGITNIEALEEIVGYYFDREKYEEALHFITKLLTVVPYSADYWQRKGLILSNLLSNAAEYTPPGGRIRVEGRIDEPQCRQNAHDHQLGQPDGGPFEAGLLD